MRERSDWMGRLNLYDTSSSTVNHQLQLTGGAVANLLSGNNKANCVNIPSVRPWVCCGCGRTSFTLTSWWVCSMTMVAWIGGVAVKSSALPRAGRGTGWGAYPRGSKAKRGRDKEEGDRLPHWSSSISLSFPLSLLHSAVASQLVPRGTWRHLVSVRTGAGTADGCGRFSSVPVAGEEAADARLQGVTGAVTPERREWEAASAACNTEIPPWFPKEVEDHRLAFLTSDWITKIKLVSLW